MQPQPDDDRGSSGGTWPSGWASIRAEIRPAGTVLYRQSDVVHSVYMIDRGLVKLARASPGGERRVLAIRSARWVLGSSSAMLGMRHPVTAETVTDAVLHAVDAAEFVHRCRHEAAVGSWMFTMLAREVHDQLEYTMSLSLGARQRLLRLLALLAQAAAHAVPAGTPVRARIALKHRELAEAIWTSRETVSRLLADLAADGIACFENGELVVPAGSALRGLMLRTAAGDPAHSRP